MTIQTGKNQTIRTLSDDQNYKTHAEDGVHFLSGTDPATAGIYYGLVVTEEASITSITYIDANLQTGDITTMTFPAGIYIPIAGGFSTITLSAGAAMLFKKAK